MPAATKTKAPAALAPTESFYDRLSREALERSIAVYQCLAAIERRHESLEPADLDLSAGERRIIENSNLSAHGKVEPTNIHAICTLLRKQRGLRVLVEELGDPSRIGEAEDALSVAHADLRETAAAIDDLDVLAGDAATPALSRQIAVLSRKLQSLESARDVAAQRVERLRQVYAQLQDRAPQPLRDVVSAALRDPMFEKMRLRRKDLLAEIQRIESGALRRLTQSPGTIPFAWIRGVCPAAIVPADKNNTHERLDSSKWLEFCDMLTKEKLPALHDELARLDRDLGDVVKQCREPIDGWIRNGGKLTAEMLQVD